MNLKPTTHQDQLRENCSAYLLGEMSLPQSETFESQLGDPIVADALKRESEMLCQIALIQSLQQDSDCEPTLQHATTDRSLISVRTIAKVFAALAASVLAISLYHMPTSTNGLSPQSLELEIAKRWVDPAIEWVADDQPIAPELIDDDVSDRDDETVTDESLDWMVAAVKASMGEGDRNDG